MEHEQFTDIFSRILEVQHGMVVTKRVPAVHEYWKELAPGGPYQCLISGRKLTRIAFRMYQDSSTCGPLGFVVKVF